VVDIGKATYADYPSFTSIDGSEAPTLTAQQKNTDPSLSTWTTSVTAGDYINFTLSSVSSLSYIVVAIYITKT
jgi:hypothetical protein